MRQVSIITASSNSGKYCIEELFTRYANQVSVKAAFRSEEKAKEFREKYPGLEVVVGVDAERPETLPAAFQGSKAALIVTPYDHSRGFEKDAKFTANLINSAVENGVEYIVLVASFTTNFLEQMPLISERFKPSEDLLEKLGKEKNIKWTVLRGGCFMENILPMAQKLEKEPVITYPNIIVPMIDTRDIGKSAAACLVSEDQNKHHGKYYEMTGPEMVSSEDLAKIYSKVLGKEIKYQELPREMIRKVMPLPVAQIFEYFVDERENGAPYKDDVKVLTGSKGYTLEEFLNFHLKK